MGKSQPQAIKPDSFAAFRQIIESNEKQVKSPELREEKKLYEVAISEGWQLIKQHIDNLKLEVDQINQNAMQTGASFEDIGKNSVIIQLTKDLLTKVVQKVEDAKEAVEGAGK